MVFLLQETRTDVLRGKEAKVGIVVLFNLIILSLLYVEMIPSSVNRT